MYVVIRVGGKFAKVVRASNEIGEPPVDGLQTFANARGRVSSKTILQQPKKYGVKTG